MKRIYLSPPDAGPRERELLLDAFDSNWIAPLGPHVDAFERECAAVVGVRQAVALSSGTAALHLGMHALGIGRGRPVITSTLTFAATANAITYVGAEPVFIDVSPDTWMMDPVLLAEELHELQRLGTPAAAVIPVDLYGQCADYDRILAVCAEASVPVIEDAAEALGATYRDRPAGGFGRAAAFSFNGNKIITTSGGGMFVTDDEALAGRVRFLSTQAREAAPHYQHAEVGFNYRMSNLLAAVGRGQLESLPSKVRRRRALKQRYRDELGDVAGLTFMPDAPYGVPTNWLTCVLIDPAIAGFDREAARERLASLDIEARPVWKPMHQQPAFAGARVRGGAVADVLFRDGLCLPSGSSLTDDEQDRVIHGVRSLRR